MRETISHYLISKKAFSYYDHDIYLIKNILSISKSKNPKVLDVGCGIGYYSVLFNRLGANVVAFDYNADLINKAKTQNSQNYSNINFLVADGRYPEKFFENIKFDIIFMSGFSLFAKTLDNKDLMKRYLSLLEEGGI